MDTLTIVSDTLAVKLKNLTDVCQPYIDGTGTNFCDVLIVLIICISIGCIAACGISKYYNDKKEERDIQKNKNEAQETVSKNDGVKNEGAKNCGSNISTDNSDEIAYKREIERQKRVLNLMQEICTLSQDPGLSKDIKGKYNDDAANKLWGLYQKIDSHHKSNVNCSSNISEQQNG